MRALARLALFQDLKNRIVLRRGKQVKARGPLFLLFRAEKDKAREENPREFTEV